MAELLNRTPPAPPGAIRRWPPPWAFVMMPLPFGIYLGYIQTPLPYLLRQLGYSVDRIGSIESLVLLPMALYFFWSPLVDFWLRRRLWMVGLSALSAGVLVVAILLLPTHAIPAARLLCLGFSINLMTTSCAGGLLALTQDEGGKAKASSWMQGGMLTAQALGGAALLYLSKHLSLGVTACLAAVMVTAPAAVALSIPEAPPGDAAGRFSEKVFGMLDEVQETLLCWRSLPGLLLLVSPVGSGAAQSLFAAMAREYQVGERGVVLLNGLLGAGLTMLGAFAAVMVPAGWDRRIAYAVAGTACALAGGFLACAPMVPWAYFVGVGLYMLTTGSCFAFFLGVVMGTMGEAGRSASSRYTILVAFGNLPIVYMTKVESLGYKAFGVRAVPALDAAGNLLVALCVAGWLLRRRSESRADVPESCAVPVEG